MKAEVLIIGAGPTGLALALALHEQGTPFRIVEQASGPAQESRAIVVQARTLEAYQQYGIDQEIISKGFPIKGLNMYKSNKHVARVDFNDIGHGISPYPFALSLAQDVHEKTLVNLLNERGIQVEWQTTVTDVKEYDDHVEVTFERTNNTNTATSESRNQEPSTNNKAHSDVTSSDSAQTETPSDHTSPSINHHDSESTPNDQTETQSFKYVCGCDGAHSVVRKSQNINFPGGTYEERFFVADVETDQMLDDFNIGFKGNHFCIAMRVRNENSMRLIGVIPKSFEGKAPETFEPLIPFVKDIYAFDISKVNWYAPYKIHHRVADTFKTKRTFILGDAGHIHSPAGGQGMNTGIIDAFNLAWKLSGVLQDKLNPELLETYDTERRAFAKKLVKTTDKMFTMMIHSKLLRLFIMPKLAPLLAKSQKMKRAFFKRISQTEINYRKSKLSKGEVGRFKGGDRLPWINRLQIDTFEPLQNVAWQFLVFGQNVPEIDEIADLYEMNVHYFPWSKDLSKQKIYNGTVLIVRPDGYIGLATEVTEISEIENYLNQLRP
ncbi:FAD-dependent monooxygenase [Staphylococcus massiliensis]|uniref:FAD-dependent oxidoreductase n=1 Tax=Staphylococcus massiliensis TaxID=555791 RepID=UPI001EDF461A|nr:FAD-dependent monooxygenase [Staphylococcus massiliensis]MCG3412798.1 FAD-dependent monooxygenase [Staphylococcus massiliensis]